MRFLSILKELQEGFLTVLDVDGRSFGFESLAVMAEAVDLGITFSVTSGDGIHFYYSSPFRIPNTKLARGVDLQGVGGYVIGPGSTHVNGAVYSIQNDVLIAPLPLTLAELLVPSPRSLPQSIPEGERHTRLRACAYAMALKGNDVDEIMRVLREMVLRCEEGVSRKLCDDELQSLAASAVTKVHKAAATMSRIVA